MTLAIHPIFLSALGLFAPVGSPLVGTPIVGPSVSEVAAVETAPELRVVPAATLQDEKKEEEKEFYGTVSAGGSVSFGNTNIKKGNLNAAATWNIDEDDKLVGTFDWFFSEEKNRTTKISSVTQRRTRGALQWNHYYNARMYAWLRADAMGDGPQQLDLRFIGTGGIGYEFIMEKDERLNGEFGLGWTSEDFKGLKTTDYVSLRVGVKYFKQINEDLKLNSQIDWYPSLEDSNDQVVLGSVQLDYNLGKGFVSTLRYEFDYDNTPPPGNHRVDSRVIFGLGYTF